MSIRNVIMCFGRESPEAKKKREEERRAKERLMPTPFADGLLLPITGDYVVPHYVNGIMVRGKDSKHEVVVSTPAAEFVVPCDSLSEAEIVRRNIARGGQLLQQSGGY